MATKYTSGTAGRRARGLSPFAIGLIALVLVTAATYFAFTKVNPFDSPYTLTGVFEHANEIKPRSPVRIAGVNVGKVTTVEPFEDGSGLARVRMEINEEGLPIKKDAKLKIRFRIFLEGNYFVDLHPGTPSAPELPSGSTIPPNQTASPVQFGQVLTALQSDTREDLQRFLREYSDALRGSGARGFNNAIKYWEDAYKYSSIQADATLGLEEHDLSRVLRGQGRVFGALSRDEEALKDLVTNLNTTVAAFARQEDNLKAAIPELRDVLKVGRPALRSLNEALPSIRAFARDALPGARSSLPTLNAQIPFLRQARRLVSKEELGGLVADLRLTIPPLARLNRGSARTFEQTRALASCQNNVLVPFATTPIPDPDFPNHTGEPWYEESGRAFVGLSGESRLTDANSSYFHVQLGGGPTTIVSTGEAGEQYFGQPLLPIDRVRPARPSKRPVFRPDIPCETQQPPDLNAVGGAGDEALPQKRGELPPKLKAEADEELRQVEEHLRRESKGLPTFDPLNHDEYGERIQAKRLGLVKGPGGRYVDAKPEAGR